MTVLSLRQIRGGYAETDILNGVDLDLSAGEILVIVGPNGSGKSTLAKATAGLLPRVSGAIQLRGKDILSLPAEQRAAAGMGYVPQVANVFPSLTVFENLAVVEHVQDQAGRIAELLRVFPALKERLRARAGSLSGGERQQLAFARALMNRPSVVVLDEPTAALSPALVEASFRQIAALAADGTAVLLIEQRARTALAIGQRGVILDEGRVAMTGPAATLLDDPKATALYLGQDFGQDPQQA